MLFYAKSARISGCKVVEVAIHWAVDVADYELQISRNAVEWTSVMHASGLAGQTVRSSFPATTADTQWIRVVTGTWIGVGWFL